MRASALPDGATAPVISGFSRPGPQEARFVIEFRAVCARRLTRLLLQGIQHAPPLRRKYPLTIDQHARRWSSPRRPADTIEEFPDTREKAAAFRMRVLRAFRLELLEQFPLSFSQVLRRFDDNLDVEIARIA